MLDMATSTVASGKIGLARQLGVPIPEGWAVGAEGERDYGTAGRPWRSLGAKPAWQHA